MDVKENLLITLEGLRSMPDRGRRRRLESLTKPILVQVAEIMLRKWERERERLTREIEKRDFHIERLESLLREGTGSSASAAPSD